VKPSLSDVVRGKQDKPVNVLVYGKDGIGKSSFAADAPGVIFLDVEGSTVELDVERLPHAETLEEVNDRIDLLLNDKHSYRSLAIDTWDWFEPMIWRDVIRSRPGKDVQSIEDFGYGKGYVYAVDTWRALLARLERLKREKSMNIISLAHGAVRTFINPEGEDYDRYELKVHKSIAGVLREWPDAVLFATYETFAIKSKTARKAKGAGDGKRVLYTEERPAFHAKNRYGLPFELSLSWEEFWKHARGAGAETADAVIARIRERFAPTELATKAENGITKIGNDLRKLRGFENYLATQLKAKETEECET